MAQDDKLALMLYSAAGPVSVNVRQLQKDATPNESGNTLTGDCVRERGSCETDATQTYAVAGTSVAPVCVAYKCGTITLNGH